MASREAQGAEGGSSGTRRQLQPHGFLIAHARRQHQPHDSWARGRRWPVAKPKGQKMAVQARDANFSPMGSSSPTRDANISPMIRGQGAEDGQSRSPRAVSYT